MAPSRRGGRRAGRPGTNDYKNRTDLLLGPRTAPVVRIPGQGYGEQAAQVSAQQQVPMGQPPLPAPLPPITRLDAPTQRPNEPLTHGLPTGPGAGPEALGMVGGDDTMNVLRAAYQQFPNPDLLRIILDEEDRRT